MARTLILCLAQRGWTGKRRPGARLDGGRELSAAEVAGECREKGGNTKRLGRRRDANAKRPTDKGGRRERHWLDQPAAARKWQNGSETWPFQPRSSERRRRPHTHSTLSGCGFMLAARRPPRHAPSRRPDLGEVMHPQTPSHAPSPPPRTLVHATLARPPRENTKAHTLGKPAAGCRSRKRANMNRGGRFVRRPQRPAADSLHTLARFTHTEGTRNMRCWKAPDLDGATMETLGVQRGRRRTHQSAARAGRCNSSWDKVQSNLISQPRDAQRS